MSKHSNVESSEIDVKKSRKDEMRKIISQYRTVYIYIGLTVYMERSVRQT